MLGGSGEFTRGKPGEVIGRQLEIGAHLAKRVEGVFVEEAERPFRHRFDLLRKDACKGADRVFAGTPGKMKTGKPPRSRAQMRLVCRPFRETRKFRIGQERRVVFRQIQLEQSVEILAFETRSIGARLDTMPAGDRRADVSEGY